MKVLDLPELDRPRERLLEHGAKALSDRELLALLLGSGVPGQDAIELAAVLIRQTGGLAMLATANPHTLRQLSGIGPAKAARIAAAFELARRAKLPVPQQRIAGTSDVAALVGPRLRGLRYECVVVVVCDNSGSVLRIETLTEGGSDAALVPVRDVLRTVLSLGGAQFAVVHNHPSGAVKPSDADLEVTLLLRQAADLAGLRFLDHVIVTEKEWARVP